MASIHDHAMEEFGRLKPSKGISRENEAIIDFLRWVDANTPFETNNGPMFSMRLDEINRNSAGEPAYVSGPTHGSYCAVYNSTGFHPMARSTTRVNAAALETAKKWGVRVQAITTGTKSNTLLFRFY